MKQIEAIKLKDMKSGAHFLFITDAVGLATADAKVKTKVTAELTALQTALKPRTMRWHCRKPTC